MDIKIKKKDLIAAIKHIKTSSYSEFLTVATDSATLEFSYEDVNKKMAKVILYPATVNVTPKKQVLSNLYDDEKVDL